MEEECLDIYEDQYEGARNHYDDDLEGCIAAAKNNLA